MMFIFDIQLQLILDILYDKIVCLGLILIFLMCLGLILIFLRRDILLFMIEIVKYYLFFFNNECTGGHTSSSSGLPTGGNTNPQNPRDNIFSKIFKHFKKNWDKYFMVISMGICIWVLVKDDGTWDYIYDHIRCFWGDEPGESQVQPTQLTGDTLVGTENSKSSDIISDDPLVHSLSNSLIDIKSYDGYDLRSIDSNMCNNLYSKLIRQEINLRSGLHLGLEYISKDIYGKVSYPIIIGDIKINNIEQLHEIVKEITSTLGKINIYKLRLCLENNNFSSSQALLIKKNIVNN